MAQEVTRNVQQAAQGGLTTSAGEGTVPSAARVAANVAREVKSGSVPDVAFLPRFG